MAKDKDEKAEYDRQYYETNKARINERHKNYYNSNKEKFSENHQRWEQENKEQRKEQKKKYYENNLEKFFNCRTRRRALECDQEISKSDWLEVMISTDWHCSYCGTVLTREIRTIDHVVPLSRGGLHIKNNLVPACKSCNSSKGVKLLSEWIKPSKSD